MPPGQPDALVASPGPKVGQQARLELTRDAGETLTDVSEGVETPMPDQVEVFHADPQGDVWGVCAGGRLLHARPSEWRWRSLPPFESGRQAQSMRSFVRFVSLAAGVGREGQTSANDSSRHFRADRCAQ